MSNEIANFLLDLYDSDKTVGYVDRDSFQFVICDPKLPYAGNSNHNQKIS